MSTKCWLWPLTANTERLSRCTRKFVHHVHEHASHSHFHKHILTLERTPTRIMTRMRRRANGGFLDQIQKSHSRASATTIAPPPTRPVLTTAAQRSALLFSDSQQLNWMPGTGSAGLLSTVDLVHGWERAEDLEQDQWSLHRSVVVTSSTCTLRAGLIRFQRVT